MDKYIITLKFDGSAKNIAKAMKHLADLTKSLDKAEVQIMNESQFKFATLDDKLDSLPDYEELSLFDDSRSNPKNKSDSGEFYKLLELLINKFVPDQN